jgi:E3 ubiquitin-protein ligase synoviolin
MDQIPAPGPPTSFHIRIATFTALLSTTDLLLVYYSLDSILTYGVSAKVLFVSEFMVLLASIMGTVARYGVNCLDIRRARGREDAPAWEAKSMYMFYIDLAVGKWPVRGVPPSLGRKLIVDFAKLLTYFTFFTVILLNYGIPLHILRDVWMTFRSFISRVSDLIRYRRATRDMDAQYPDATEEDVGRLGDRVCIICREEMVVRGGHAEGQQTGEAGQAEGSDVPVEGNGETTQPQPAPPADEDGPNETPKKLVCGHVFHFHCLRSWLERQQSCPTWCVSPSSLYTSFPTTSSLTRPFRPYGSILMNSRRDVLHTTPTTQQRRPAPPAPAPAPAPGAVPQPPNNVALREQYEEFFRIPQENGVIPTPPAPAPVPTNGITAGPTPPPVATAAAAAETAEDRIQTSIWGGPIQPGRFFAPPLGSIRRNIQPQPRAGPSRPNPVPIRTSIPIPNSNYNNDAPRSAFPAPRGYGFNSPVLPSEASTPFSSNPPEVFRSMSSGSDAGSGEAESSMEGVVDEGGRGNRRLAAEAAMRRMGLTRPGMKGKEKEKERSIPEPTPTETTATATATATVSKESQETKKINETYTPYLSPIARAPHPMADRSPWSKRGSLDDKVQSDNQVSFEREGGGIPFGREGGGISFGREGEGGGRGGMREGVEERLRTLKRVDDTVWGLVEELTRIRSLMDTENEEEEGVVE